MEIEFHQIGNHLPKKQFFIYLNWSRCSLFSRIYSTSSSGTWLRCRPLITYCSCSVISYSFGIVWSVFSSSFWPRHHFSDPLNWLAWSTSRIPFARFKDIDVFSWFDSLDKIQIYGKNSVHADSESYLFRKAPNYRAELMLGLYSIFWDVSAYDMHSKLHYWDSSKNFVMQSSLILLL